LRLYYSHSVYRFAFDIFVDVLENIRISKLLQRTNLETF